MRDSVLNAPFYHAIIKLCYLGLLILVTQLKMKGRKEGNVLFNDALNTFYLRLYG